MNIDCGKYIIKSDTYNLWIEEKYTMKKGAKKGEEATRVITGYHQSFERLLECFLERKMRSSEAQEVADMLKEFSVIEADLKQLAKGLADGLKEEWGEVNGKSRP